MTNPTPFFSEFVKQAFTEWNDKLTYIRDLSESLFLRETEVCREIPLIVTQEQYDSFIEHGVLRPEQMHVFTTVYQI